MSKIPPLQCLFCKHCNLASARYCNECASPLHLQPCNECGAIDNRTAGTCYKCGTQFNVPAAPKRAPVSAAPKRAPASAAPKRARAPAAPKRAPAPAAAPELAAVPAAPVPESVPAPPILEHQIAKPILNDGGSAIERAFLSKSPARVAGTFRQGLRHEVTETQGQAARVVDRDPTHVNPDLAHSAVELQPMDETVAPESVQNADLAHSAVERQPMDETVAPASVQNPDLAHSTVESQPMDETVAPESVQYPVLALSAVEPQPMDETVESERAVTATGSRRARRLALVTLLLAATAASGYYYYDRSAKQLAQGQSAGQPAPSMPDGPISVGATTPTVATQVDATSAPKDTTSQPTAGAEEVGKAPSPAARVVANPEPVPASRPLDDPASVSRPAAMPQAAGAARSVRPSSVIDAGVKSRKDPPIFKECTEPVAALGLCGPTKP